MRILLPWLLLSFTAGGALAERPISDRRTLREELTFSHPVQRSLEVDNLYGSITVTADDGETVRMTAHETVEAETAEQLDLARREVSLDISARGNTVAILVDGPFRCDDGAVRGDHCWPRWRDRGYQVRYDFELLVPRTLDLVLSTINDGQVAVRGVSGTFSVRNVNGSIALAEVAGGGRLRTVNGAIDLELVAQPTAGWSLKTINGDLDASFPGDLAADLRFEVRNGDVFTDFEVAPRTLPSAQPTRRGDRFVFKVEPAFGARVAAGGPELAFDTLNGNIYVRNAQRVR